MGKPKPPEHPVLDEWERRIDENLARVSHRTVDDVRREARQRALQIEVESMRRH